MKLSYSKYHNWYYGYSFIDFHKIYTYAHSGSILISNFYGGNEESFHASLNLYFPIFNESKTLGFWVDFYLSDGQHYYALYDYRYYFNGSYGYGDLPDLPVLNQSIPLGENDLLHIYSRTDGIDHTFQFDWNFITKEKQFTILEDGWDRIRSFQFVR